ncbi:MAG: anion permease [Myxococcales bacterium]|nr:MAG: anion permease [Myxococcales bacterium]
MEPLTLIIVGTLLALSFDFLNGLNDAANSIATVVSTRVLSPRVAVLWAAMFNLIGAFVFGVSVAATIGKGIIDPSIVTPTLILGALVGGIVWTHICTTFGLPISVSHSLIGGLCGAGFVRGGFDAMVWSGIGKVALFIVLSPIIGMVLGGLLMVACHWIFRNVTKRKVETLSRKMQLLSSAVFALGHGTNDAQKTMGIITVLLFSAGFFTPGFQEQHQLPLWATEILYAGAAPLGDGFPARIPTWIIASCTLAIALGTWAGGWKVIRTVGIKLTRLRPIGGFAAETGGGLTVLLASLTGIPVSTTHTIAGSIAGVGMVTSLGAVRWGVAKHIVWAWVLTIPVSALVGALTYKLLLWAGI